MACQDLLVFMVVVGAFAIESSPSPVPPKASSPSKTPSPSSPASSLKSPSIKSSSQSSNGSSFSPSKSDEGVPNLSHPRSPNSYSSSSSPSPSQSDNPNTNKGYSSEVESPEEDLLDIGGLTTSLAVSSTSYWQLVYIISDLLGFTCSLSAFLVGHPHY
ncbi:early nodulin-20-like [Gossypium arboreum]|uniref:early nodulin-20-like n=1 Tax=Gossypium arboreum TaxID=29729 RepID=UPI0022F15B05|nr:early nodulin-20-like [Gossypium arboreum]